MNKIPDHFSRFAFYIAAGAKVQHFVEQVWPWIFKFLTIVQHHDINIDNNNAKIQQICCSRCINTLLQNKYDTSHSVIVGRNTKMCWCSPKGNTLHYSIWNPFIHVDFGSKSFTGCAWILHRWANFAHLYKS